jgi:hypothetical protein
MRTGAVAWLLLFAIVLGAYLVVATFRAQRMAMLERAMAAEAAERARAAAMAERAARDAELQSKKALDASKDKAAESKKPQIEKRYSPGDATRPRS